MDDKRTIVYDKELGIEACLFNGIMQKFPNHFHEYYVMGFVESGCRSLSCNHKDAIIHTGDIVLFNPGDNHSCCQVDDNALIWRCIHIQKENMLQVTKEVTGRGYLPVFNTTVINATELADRLKVLNELILNGASGFEKEELFYLLIEELVETYTEPLNEIVLDTSAGIQKVCDFMERNYMDRIKLDELAVLAGLKKYTLLRHFIKQRGITPYQYLETVRVNAAKKKLEEGVSLIEAAMLSGFADQSHFTRFFKNFSGLTPKQYQDIFKKQDY